MMIATNSVSLSPSSQYYHRQFRLITFIIDFIISILRALYHLPDDEAMTPQLHDKSPSATQDSEAGFVLLYLMIMRLIPDVAHRSLPPRRQVMTRLRYFARALA